MISMLLALKGSDRIFTFIGVFKHFWGCYFWHILHLFLVIILFICYNPTHFISKPTYNQNYRDTFRSAPEAVTENFRSYNLFLPASQQ